MTNNRRIGAKVAGDIDERIAVNELWDFIESAIKNNKPFDLIIGEGVVAEYNDHEVYFRKEIG